MAKLQTRHYSAAFLSAYFFYYAGYCVFSSYIVSYLTQLGYNASLCGAITSLTLMANLLMEPVGGYLTDTFLSTRRYLTLCIGAIVILCLAGTFFSSIPSLCLSVLILTAGIAYPFSQLMDAWVNCSRSLDPQLVYSRIRAGGSIGYAITSVLTGYYFERFGWGSYFLMQAALFLLMVPFLCQLPHVELRNHKAQTSDGHSLSPAESFLTILRDRTYILCLLLCTVYWFSHRPIGSYLALIVLDRAGDVGAFGSVCGLGATVEFFSLLLLSCLQRRGRLPLWLCMTAALLTNVLRPLCISLLPGIWPLYLGQAMQSVSFALFFVGSVECFTRVADARIRSFCISVGLTVSSVGGTISATLLGGWLCDLHGSSALVSMSLVSSLINCLLLLLCFKPIFLRDKRKLAQ